MSSAQIKMSIHAKNDEMRAAFLELSKWHIEKSDEISRAYASEMHDLNVQLRRAEAEEAYQAELRREEEAEHAANWLAGDEEAEGWNVGLAQRQQATWQTPVAQAEEQDEPCYDCGRSTANCLCQSQLNAEAEVFQAPHKEGTKLKWVSNSNPETYSVAIVKKDYILEVKRVTDGGGYCHNPASCECSVCNQILLSRGRTPIPRAPLVKTFFATEADWLASLPQGGSRGSIQATVPAISARQLKKSSCTPLTGATDGLKLKELAQRFPGGTMVLQTSTGIFEVEHVYYDIASYPENWCHQIYSRKLEKSFMNFSDLGKSPRSNGKPQFMVEWKGLYIDLSHLF
jgi:hypothetical protein